VVGAFYGRGLIFAQDQLPMDGGRGRVGGLRRIGQAQCND